MPQVCKHQRREGEDMLFLEILSCVVSILAGFVSLAKEYKSYIQRHKERTEKDPSASLAASDGSEDDCISKH